MRTDMLKLAPEPDGDVDLGRLPEDLEGLVVMERLSCYNRGLPCGAAALRRRLRERYGERSAPSVGWIGRVLSRHGLTHGRTGRYESEES
jgi:hypothetical protein